MREPRRDRCRWAAHGTRQRECRQAARCRDRWACGRRTCGGRRYPRRLLRLMRQTALPRHLPDRLGQTRGSGGRGVSAGVPGVWWRHPTHRVHYRSGADPEDPGTSRRTARTTARLAGPRATGRLGRARSGPRRPGNLSGTDRRTARDRHPQPLTEFKPRCGRPARRAVSRPVCADEKNPTLSVDRKLFGTSTIGSHPARSAPAVAPHDSPRSADACRSAIGRPILSGIGPVRRSPPRNMVKEW